MTVERTAARQGFQWQRVLDLDELPEGRVVTVGAGRKSMAITHYDGQYGALDNKCPHNGGPLGQGTIEKGWLRCPWHGYDYDPLNGQPPPPIQDCPASFDVDVRDDGIYVAVPIEEESTRSVSDVMVETMLNWGVHACFGMVGSSNLGFAEAMRTQEAAGALQYIGVRHEGAAFAAPAYAKLTGTPAACFGIAGPGATNLLTGLWNAKMDRAPVLALTGQVNSQVLGPGRLPGDRPQQRLRVCHNLESDGAAGFATRGTHEPGGQTCDFAARRRPPDPAQRGAGSARRRSDARLWHRRTACAARDRSAGRVGAGDAGPAAGQQTAGDHRRPRRPLRHGRRAGARRAPQRTAATTFKAKGLVADDHPLGCGVLGHSGTPIASWFMNEADLLLVFGASFSDHTGSTPFQPTIQVDTDPMALGKTHPIDVPVGGDIGVTARRLLGAIGDEVQTDDQRPQIAERWDLWQAEKASRALDDRGRGIAGAALNRHVPDDAVMTVDISNNTYSFGRYFECTRQSVLMSSYLGSIGFAYPAAIGAWAPAPDRPIVAIAGGRDLGQYLAEVTTAVKYGMPIKAIIVNNSELGRISSEQREEEMPIWSTSLHNPNFATFAENCGAFGVRVESAAELDDALSAAFAHDGPALVDVVSDPQLV